MANDLLRCPMCGGTAERVDVPPEAEDENAGASFIACTRCNLSTGLAFDRKENLVSSWNDRKGYEHDLLDIAKRWAALDGGSWHIDRHAREKTELLADTKALISKAEASDVE